MKIKLVIPGSQDHVRLVGRALKGILEENVQEGEDLFLIELAVCEAVANSIKHAYAGRSLNNVEVEVDIGASEIIIEVRDEGQKPDSRFLDKNEFQQTCALESMQEGGRGIPIINEVMDHVDYYSSCGKNILIMRKNISPSRKT
ncbi:MAG: ATP-binding protein [Thermodesulfobacteriota bacterium]